MLRFKTSRSQTAIDFLTTYGMALMIISIAIVAIYQLSIMSPNLNAYTCTASPGFSCDFFSLSSKGVLTISLSQATGGQIQINGAACSSQINATGIGPRFGNIHVTDQQSVGSNPVYTTGNAPPLGGISVYSGSGTTLSVYCYSSPNTAGGPLGNSFNGYFWLNYTVPGYGATTLQVASMSTTYT